MLARLEYDGGRPKLNNQRPLVCQLAITKNVSKALALAGWLSTVVVNI